ncbi:DoxX family protein [Leptospira sarikeiensis]|uniref:DoxX family protein n=1 Tax=Leptospira sarikeiensis TaxID=2484943 RepID=A0A4R9K3G5_9LEPT|nr:DoxX family protein [Leptospira sarikeiensis]TGL60600.1 hypothetical protein EHQ64_12270 [Leptospira sarikeiensis]
MQVGLKILNAILILFAVFMGVKAGWSILSESPEMVQTFEAWGVGRYGRILFAVVGIIGAILLLHPKTYVFGNFLVLAVILFLIVNYVHLHDWKGVGIEFPFFLLQFVILYIEHPLQGFSFVS